MTGDSIIDRMRHAFTVDLEDWSDGIPIPAVSRASTERRLHFGTEHLLEMLERRGVKATFFILSPLLDRNPELLRRIADAGHEIGSHGLSHDLIYEMSPQRFREETRASIDAIQDAFGRPVRSYRAAYFSITRRSLWALDILASLGIRYDSSIFPVNNWRYGIPDYSRRPVEVTTDYGPLLEFPMSTLRRFGRNVPTTGGAYFRIYPYALTRANIRASEREGIPVVFYLHPWELDPDHPFVRFKAQAMITHYVNLRATAPRLERLLDEFEFTTLGDVLDHEFTGSGQRLLQS
jgi:polysaccharide deacetylase family protein (PEP-CTERM system associated)